MRASFASVTKASPQAARVGRHGQSNSGCRIRETFHPFCARRNRYGLATGDDCKNHNQEAKAWGHE